MKDERENEAVREESLTGIIERYMGEDMTPEQETAFGVIRKAVIPGIPATAYIRTNALFLKNLFTKIERKHHVTHEDLVNIYRPLVTGALERYYEDLGEPLHPFTGSWLKAEDLDISFIAAEVRTSLTRQELMRLRDRLLRHDTTGPEFAFALSLFAGLTIHEARSARFRDLSELEDYPGCYMLHTMGEFPKHTRATDYDTRPRWVPLEPMLANAIIKRREAAEAAYSFPLTGRDGFGGEIMTGSVEDLPIAGASPDAPQEFLHIAELADEATKILLEAGVQELSLASREGAMLETPALFRVERSAAYYFARASFATRLFGAGLPVWNVKSALGHINEEGRYEDMTEAEMFDCIRTLSCAA